MVDDGRGVLAMDLGCNGDQECLDALDRQAVAWGIAVLRHAMADIRRRELRLREHELLILDAPVPGSGEDEDETGAERTVAGALSTEDQAIGDVAAMELLSALTERERTAVVLLADGYSEREVGLRMGISDRVVRRLRDRARQRLS